MVEKCIKKQKLVCIKRRIPSKLILYTNPMEKNPAYSPPEDAYPQFVNNRDLTYFCPPIILLYVNYSKTEG